MQVIIVPALQMVLDEAHRFHPVRGERDQIKAKSGIDPLDLVAKQAVQMGRVAGAGGGRNIHMADIAVGAIHCQMQTAAPHTCLLQSIA